MNRMQKMMERRIARRHDERNTRALETLQRGSYGSTGERLAWKYYDETTVPTVAGVVNMFQVPQSGTKGIEQTNMVQSGSVPQGQKFVVKSLEIMYRSKDGVATPAEANELNAILDRTIVTLVINNKAPMVQMKLSSLLGASLMCPNTGTAGAVSQFGTFSGKWKLATPVVLAGLVPFKVEVINTAVPATSVQGDFITISLCGTLYRAL